MKESGFQFKGFLIKKSTIVLNKVEDLDLSIKFNPSGVLNKKDSFFKLSLEVIISEEDSDFNVEVLSEGLFEYNDLSDDKLNNFLYLNAPAILFPYIRAYITSLTALSGISPIVLPTLNLSSLKEDLERKVEIIE